MDVNEGMTAHPAGTERAMTETPERHEVTVERNGSELTYITAKFEQDETTVVEEVVKRDGTVVLHKQHMEHAGERMTHVLRHPLRQSLN